MDISELSALDGFEDIWRRVTGVSCRAEQERRQAPAAETVLREHIADAALRESELRTLSRRMKSAQTRLLRLAERLARRRELMQAEFFLMTGDTAAIQVPERVSGSVNSGALALLRNACIGADRAAAAMLSSAELTNEQTLAPLFRRLAAGERELSDELRRLIASALT